MEYRVDLFDPWMRRIASFRQVPILDATRTGPDGRDTVSGLLPKEVSRLGAAFWIRVYVEGRLFCQAPVQLTLPQWGDAKKLILDQYVPFHEIVEVRAASESGAGNTWVSRAYVNRETGAMARDAINSARGPVHYYVAHGAPPGGAVREYQKFLARQTGDNALETGGISQGQWVDAARMDLSQAFAKDGDTISGIVVDGAPWPDLRLMMIDAEESSINSHAIDRRPEVGSWSEARYSRSYYRRRAAEAQARLQGFLDNEGISHIELNPHRDSSGDFDDRVDAYGRYIGLVYGGGRCFNAALAEEELADIYLYDGGRYHEPGMALKDYYSYTAPHVASIEDTGVVLGAFDAENGLYEVLTALAYAAGGFCFQVDPTLGVRFGRRDAPDHVVYFDPARMAVQFGADASLLTNYLHIEGNPLTGSAAVGRGREESIEAYGIHSRGLDYFSLSMGADAERLAEGLLDDLAYPEPRAEVVVFAGQPEVGVGDLIEFRGAPLRMLEELPPSAWGGRFGGALVARVHEVRHRFTGRRAATTIRLGSPLRSVRSPLSYLVRSQQSAAALFAFRLDQEKVGLDMGFHLD